MSKLAQLVGLQKDPGVHTYGPLSVPGLAIAIACIILAIAVLVML